MEAVKLADFRWLKASSLTFCGPEFVQQATGAQLHRFTWLQDELIGALPKDWNWLPDELGPNPQAKLLHWTLGAPCFDEFVNAQMADEWHRERELMNESVQREIEAAKSK
jgi:hypothetical protein